MAFSIEAIEHAFGFHKATIEGENATLPKHASLRAEFKQFAQMLENLLPDGRAKSVAFTQLENASMWAHKAVAELAPLVDEVNADLNPVVTVEPTPSDDVPEQTTPEDPSAPVSGVQSVIVTDAPPAA